jgi:hypothetical protein
MGDTVIVVPCYDEARRLNVGAFQQFATEFDSVAFLFVDDGSRDQTLQVLDHLVATAPDRFARLSLGRNYGKAEAVRRGLLHALASDVAGPLPARGSGGSFISATGMRIWPPPCRPSSPSGSGWKTIPRPNWYSDHGFGCSGMTSNGIGCDTD